MSINYAGKIPPPKQDIVKLLYESFAKKNRERGANATVRQWKKEVCGWKVEQPNALEEMKEHSRQRGKCKQKTWLRREAVDALYWNCALKLTHHVPANLSWQSQRLTGSLVLLFPFSFCLRLANVSSWRSCLYLSALPAAPPGYDFHFSRVV